MWDERKTKAQLFIRDYGRKKIPWPFKLLHRHVIVNSNVLVCHCLLEPLPSKTLTSQESQWMTFRKCSSSWVQGRAYIGERSIGFRSRWRLRGSSKRNEGIKFDDRGLGQSERAKFRLLIALTAKKVSSIECLGCCFPLLWLDWKDGFQCHRSRWTRLNKSISICLDGLITTYMAFSLVLLYGCHSYKRKGERRWSKFRRIKWDWTRKSAKNNKLMSMSRKFVS